MTDRRSQGPNGPASGDDAVDQTGLRIRQVDRQIGERIRERRIMLGLSQQQLATMINVTYQQAHKYETGINRVSAGRLFLIAEVLAAPLDWFFEGLATTVTPLAAAQRMCIELTRDFSAIDDERQRDALSQLARIFAEQAARQEETSLHRADPVG